MPPIFKFLGGLNTYKSIGQWHTPLIATPLALVFS
jgi:hypothetical protein